jgi:hypothetical protein
LEKRSKKLSVLRIVATAGPRAPGAKVFCFFFSKKEALLFSFFRSYAAVTKITGNGDEIFLCPWDECDALAV